MREDLRNKHLLAEKQRIAARETKFHSKRNDVSLIAKRLLTPRKITVTTVTTVTKKT